MDMHTQLNDIVEQIGRTVLGKREQIKMALTCLLAGGHLLIEDIPGIGKTTLAKVLSRCMGLEFRRVQFTSDMLPGDILDAIRLQDRYQISFWDAMIIASAIRNNFV